jgi:hypothetical protein
LIKTWQHCASHCDEKYRFSSDEKSYHPRATREENTI